jgi:glycerol transport system ATP-binding protein
MALELEDVSLRVGGETLIHPTTLCLEAGGFNILLGATGAGKSTLIRLMSGLEAPTSGLIRAEGRDVTGVSPQRRNISLVHQFFVNYGHMTVFDNIASPLRVAGVPKSEIAGRVEAAADMLKLRPMLKRRPQELLGGQQQRTALARAVVKESTAIFLDEPLANLDYKLREELREQLPELLAGRGTVVVYATSEPTEALLLGGRTALVHEGRVTQFGSTAEIYRSPETLTSARVFSDPPINTVPATKSGDRIALAGADWPATGPARDLVDGDYTLAVRPHNVTPKPPEGHSVPLSGTVRITELTGSESIAHFEVGDRLWVSQSAGVHPYRIGEAHEFHLLSDRCFFFAADGRLAAGSG